MKIFRLSAVMAFCAFTVSACVGRSVSPPTLEKAAVSHDLFAGSEGVLYSFRGLGDGANPVAPLTRSGGVLYGVTENGGTFGSGTVFRIQDGTESVIYRFSGGNDGYDPLAPVIVSGTTLYGTTQNGGKQGDGTVYSLQLQGNLFVKRTLYAFRGGFDGQYPVAPLWRDPTGALLGTAEYAGRHNDGVVYKLTPAGSTYGESTVYAFRGDSDGQNPTAGLVPMGGTLYGTTQFGGRRTSICPNYGCGTVYALTPSGSGYAEHVIYRFRASADGAFPLAGLLAAGSDTLYGTTFGGSVFKIVKNGAAYTETTLYHFKGGADGNVPAGGVAADATGSLYGTTEDGGNGYGTIFKLTPVQGAYQKSTLYAFQSGVDAEIPKAGLIWGVNGLLLGTTYAGGTEDEGAVFELTPR